MTEKKIYKERKRVTLKRIKSYTSKAVSLLESVAFSPLFYIPLFLKLVAGSFFASSFAVDLFIPFVTEFSVNPLINPYNTFLLEGNIEVFPYPLGMLIFLSLPYLVFSGLVTESISPLSLLLFRSPLLFADLVILIVLLSWFKDKKKDILLLYWMSPVLFYITYMHGQLDVVPMALLLVAIYLISKKRDTLGLVVFGTACAAKMSVFIVAPFLFLYLYREREKIKTFLFNTTIPFLVFLAINIPVIFSNGFYELVFKTKEQLKVFDLFFVYSDSLYLYVTPLILFLLVLYVARLKRFSRNIIVASLAISFIALLLLVSPRQGWYFWVIPFVVYLYIQLPSSKRISLHLLSISYFIYFAIIPESDFLRLLYLGNSNRSLYLFLEHCGAYVPTLVNVAFTILQGSLLYVGYTVYRYGLLEYTRQKLYYKPFIMGVAGDSGSGKTTFADSISQVFSSFQTVVVNGDDMHKWERGHEKWKDHTHLDPLANNLHAEIETLRKISQDEPFTRRAYDHSTGTFTMPKTITPKRLVIFEGLHPFFLEKVRKSFDLRIYVSPEEQLRLHWKIIRDVTKRGYSKDKVISILEKRKDDSVFYISTQQKHADVVFSLRNKSSLGDSLGDPDSQLELSLFVTCSNDINVEYFLQLLTPHVSIEYAITDKQQTIKITGDISVRQVESIASEMFKEIDDITDEIPIWKDNFGGIMQLFTIFYIFETLKIYRHEA
jgi:uridine kinase